MIRMGCSLFCFPETEKQTLVGVQPSMGEILVARGKRRRSVAPGRNEMMKPVRTKVFFNE